MPDTDSYDHCFKVLIVGDPGVGKSSLLVRYCDDKFSESTSSTIGVDFRTKVVTLRDKRIKLSIWDTAGQEKFRTLTSSYYRNAHGVILMYDATNRESFDHMTYWLDQVKSQCTYPEVVAMLIAGKLDYPKSLIKISRTEGEIFAVEHSMLFEETSSKSNSKVDLCFEELVLNMLDQPKLVATSSPPLSSSIHQQSSKILTPTSSCSSSCYLSNFLHATYISFSVV